MYPFIFYSIAENVGRIEKGIRTVKNKGSTNIHTLFLTVRSRFQQKIIKACYSAITILMENRREGGTYENKG